jgi:hypothetical protein
MQQARERLCRRSLSRTIAAALGGAQSLRSRPAGVNYFFRSAGPNIAGQE